VYTVAITATVGIVATLALHGSNHYNEMYVILSVVVFTTTTTAIFLAMLPKVRCES